MLTTQSQNTSNRHVHSVFPMPMVSLLAPHDAKTNAESRKRILVEKSHLEVMWCGHAAFWGCNVQRRWALDRDFHGRESVRVADEVFPGCNTQDWTLHRGMPKCGRRSEGMNLARSHADVSKGWTGGEGGIRGASVHRAESDTYPGDAKTEHVLKGTRTGR